MSTAIERMLESYEVETIYDQKNAMKEIMQEIVLCGLSRAGFFKKAAFIVARLLQSNCVPEDFSCSSENLRALLNERFAQIDYKQAKRDVEPFISSSSMLELWPADFFNQITEGLRVC